MGSSEARWWGAYMHLMKLSWCVYIRCTYNKVPRIQGLENCCQRCQPSNFVVVVFFLYLTKLWLLCWVIVPGAIPQCDLGIFFFFSFFCVHVCNFRTIYCIRWPLQDWVVSHYRRKGLITDWEILALLGNFSRHKSFANQSRVQITLLLESLFAARVQTAWP